MAGKGKSRMPSYWQSSEVPKSEKLTVGAIGVLVAYTSWAGVNPSYAGYVTVALSLLVLGLLLASDGIDRREGLLRSTPRWRLMLREPVCGFASLFLLYLLLQWFNAGRGSSPPLVPWLPSAVDGRGAWELLASFLPVVAVLLAVRHGLYTHRSLWAVLNVAALVGTIMAVFGIVQHLLGADEMFWFIPVSGRFFGSFSEPGHAATYCILVLCISLSFCASDWHLLHVVERPLDGRFYVALVSAAICIAAVFLTQSHISLVFAWLVLLLAAGQAALGCWEAMTPGHRLNATVLLAGVIAVAYFTTIDTTPYRVGLWRMETSGNSSSSTVSLETHSQLCRDAFRVWKQHAAFGTGGGGFDSLQDTLGAAPPDARCIAGTMRVHCDPLELLVELGLVGMVLLVGMVVMAGRRILGGGLWRDPFFLFGLIGLAWVLLNSFFATPFRSPGILSLWAVAWIAFSRLVALEKR